MRALSSQWFAAHRERMACWHHDDLGQILEDVEQIKHEVWELIQLQLHIPANVTVTATDQEGNTMSTFAPGATITFTAATVNAEGTPLATDADGNPFTYTWATTAGTIAPGADTSVITISDAPLGDLTVTATDPAGLAGTVTVTVADQTPVAVTVTAA